jgi:hypothetical protein
LSEGRAAIGYNHGHDAEVFYLGLTLDPANVEGFVEGCLERIGEDDPDGEYFLRDIWEDAKLVGIRLSISHGSSLLRRT